MLIQIIGLEFDKYSGEKIYEGHFYMNKRSGIGEEYFPNGITKFKGEWLDGLRHGKGIEYDWEGAKIVEGRYEKGKIKSKMRLANFLPEKDCDIQHKSSNRFSRLRSIKECKQDTITELEMEMKLVNIGIVEEIISRQNMQNNTCSISEFTDEIMSQGCVKSMKLLRTSSNNSSSADKKLTKEKNDKLDLLQVSPVRINYKKINHKKYAKIRRF